MYPNSHRSDFRGWITTILVITSATRGIRGITTNNQCQHLVFQCLEGVQGLLSVSFHHYNF